MKSLLFSVLLLLIVTLCSFIPVVEVAKERRKKETDSFWSWGNSESSDENDINKKKQDILDRLLDKSVYDKRVRPPGNGPTNISVSMYILDVIDVDEYLKEYGLLCYFRQKWRDERLKDKKNDDDEANFRKIRSTETERIWKPDLFFINEIKGEKHQLMVPNQFLHLEPDGEVLISHKLSLILSCNSNPKFYPHDEQKCNMSIESYGFTFNELALSWDGDKAVGYDEKLSSNSKYILLGHDLISSTVTMKDSVYGHLRLELHFARNFHPFLISIYLPHILLVILSWACFCIDHKNVTLRLIYLGLIMFLILKLLPAERGPDLHVTALDIWTATCVAFILFSFLEAIFVNQVANQEDIEKAKNLDAEQQGMNSGHMNVEKVEKKSESSKESKLFARLTRKCHTRSERVDVMCRMISPILFLLFNIMYWSVCCSASKYD